MFEALFIRKLAYLFISHICFYIMENEVRLPTAAEDAQLFEQEKLDRVASIKL